VRQRFRSINTTFSCLTSVDIHNIFTCMRSIRRANPMVHRITSVNYPTGDYVSVHPNFDGLTGGVRANPDLITQKQGPSHE
jgi:hypothetical protein